MTVFVWPIRDLIEINCVPPAAIEMCPFCTTRPLPLCRGGRVSVTLLFGCARFSQEITKLRNVLSGAARRKLLPLNVSMQISKRAHSTIQFLWKTQLQGFALFIILYCRLMWVLLQPTPTHMRRRLTFLSVNFSTFLSRVQIITSQCDKERLEGATCAKSVMHNYCKCYKFRYTHSKIRFILTQDKNISTKLFYYKIHSFVTMFALSSLFNVYQVKCSDAEIVFYFWKFHNLFTRIGPSMCTILQLFDFLIQVFYHKDACQRPTPVQTVACILNPERSLKAV